MLAYTTSLRGLEKESKRYVDLSLSAKTQEKLLPLYESYLEYATIALSYLDLNIPAFELSKRIKNPLQRAAYLKKSMKYLSTEEKLLDVLLDDVLKIYNTKIYSPVHFIW